MIKFDFCIGNPPYQDNTIGNNDNFAPPVYDKFIDGACSVASIVELIHPARFLFNAGSTQKKWNRKMLNDPHFKILSYEPLSQKIFSNTDIKGGLAISFRIRFEYFGRIGVFTAYKELNSIVNRLKNYKYISFSTIVYPRSSYMLQESLFEEYPDLVKRLNCSKNLETNIFDSLPNLFFDKKPNDGEEYCCLLGRQKNERVYKYIKLKYIDVPDNYYKYKVIIPKSNGSGAIGEVLSTPLIGTPLIGHTQTFLSIGAFKTRNEAENTLKYVKSKFARVLLGVLKITQDNPPEKWQYVPLQDFTEASDINWNTTVHEIDLQLYKKYGLDKDEIDFIETHVKAME